MLECFMQAFTSFISRTKMEQTRACYAVRKLLGGRREITRKFVIIIGNDVCCQKRCCF